MVKYSKSTGGSSRKIYQAGIALRRAANTLRKRSSVPLGMPSTRGFTGNYTQYQYRGNAGRELKFNDVTFTNNAAAAGTSTVLNGIAQGADYNQRIGRKINMTSILWNVRIYPNAVTNESGECIRCMVVYDSQPNSGTIAAATDILATATPGSAMNLNNRDRFKVIFDKRYTMNPVLYNTGTLAAGCPQYKFSTKYKKLNLPVIFSGTAGTTGALQTGSLISLIISDSTSTSVVVHDTRVRFEDS